MKKVLLYILLSTNAIVVLAQQPITISTSGGFTNTSSSMQTKAYFGNGYNIQTNVFVPFLSINNDKFMLGVLAGGIYSTAKNLAPATDGLKTQYKLYNGNLAINNGQNQETSSGITGYLGLQANFSLGPLTLSPSINGGYLNLRQKGFTQSTIVQSNGSSQTIMLADLPETSSKGFITIPQLKISYSLTEAFGIYTSAGFNIGPNMNINQRRLEPAGGFNNNNTYEPVQLSSGKMVEMPTVSTNYQSIMFNIGLSWNLGRKLKNTPKMPSRLSMNTTTARQTSGKTFGEKVNQGLQASKTDHPLYNEQKTETTNPIYNSNMARPGQPIKGVIVKGGKNPGGSTMRVSSDDNGKFELNGLEKGYYKFIIEFPDNPQGKSIDQKGVKREEVRTYTGGRKNDPQEKSIGTVGIKHQSGAASPSYAAMVAGQPIKGIIVKGGKNPGGSTTNLTIHEDGTIQFKVLKKGNYQFLIETSEEPSNKDAKEKVKGTGTVRTGLKDVVRTQV
ncbi:carboxypeptidase-like regulatory domain-containing protein [Pedobacter sp.]|uniref:carboxypeptidase-like regulatory domain-containing protein n=1 Tax=Pedobacter sp. TaxID=1411316 RepID=UPI00396CF8B2